VAGTTVLAAGTSAPPTTLPTAGVTGVAGVSASSAGAGSDTDAGVTAGASGDTGGGGVGGASSTGPVEPVLPMATGMCPTLATGYATLAGSSVQLWVGKKATEATGMILIYWHVTGGSTTEITSFGPSDADIKMITDGGGIVAAPNNSLRTGSDTGDAVWYTGDFAISDQIVACAVQQLNIDPHRIYTMGGSAGALQAGIMVYKRSSYLAASVPNSGGYTIGGNTLENPAHVPAVMTLHGAMGSDVVIVDFSQQSLVLDVDVVKKGGFAIDCNHGGGHVGAPANLREAGFKFLMDHPFGVTPEPYANGLPSTFPTYCKIIKATDMAPAGCCATYMQGDAGASGGAGGS
jgi:hypothetical protein